MLPAVLNGESACGKVVLLYMRLCVNYAVECDANLRNLESIKLVNLYKNRRRFPKKEGLSADGLTNLNFYQLDLLIGITVVVATCLE